jgi:hypothetical protein
LTSLQNWASIDACPKGAIAAVCTLLPLELLESHIYGIYRLLVCRYPSIVIMHLAIRRTKTQCSLLCVKLQEVERQKTGVASLAFTRILISLTRIQRMMFGTKVKQPRRSSDEVESRKLSAAQASSLRLQGSLGADPIICLLHRRRARRDYRVRV